MRDRPAHGSLRPASSSAAGAKLAIVCHSSTGTIAEIAQEPHEAAIKAGAEVHLLKAAELAPRSTIDSSPVGNVWFAGPLQL